MVSSSLWLVLERTLEGSGDIVEFFVSPSCVDEFDRLMNLFVKMSMVVWFKQMPNRIEYELRIDA
jgi:hypothetical protein